MRTNLTLKQISKTSVLEDTIDKNTEKIEKRLKKLKGETAHLSIHIEKNPHKEQYYCWMNLYLPSKEIFVKEKLDSLLGCLSKTFLSLIKQVDKYKHRVEKHLLKKKRNSKPVNMLDNEIEV